MAIIQIQAEISLAELLHGVQQLDSATLEQFADEVLLLRAKRRAPALPKGEVNLLQQINQGLSATTHKRFKELKQKRDEETLTPPEYDELLAIIEKIEQRDVERLQALTELAHLRGISVRKLMDQLGLTRTDDA